MAHDSFLHSYHCSSLYLYVLVYFSRHFILLRVFKSNSQFFANSTRIDYLLKAILFVSWMSACLVEQLLAAGSDYFVNAMTCVHHGMGILNNHSVPKPQNAFSLIDSYNELHMFLCTLAVGNS